MKQSLDKGMSTKKFLFEQSFDDARTLAVQDAIAEPKFSQADLDKAAQDGHQSGLAAAMQSIEKHTMDLCQSILAGVQNMVANYARDSQMITEKSLAVVLQSLKKLLPELYARHGVTEIESVIRQCLSIAHEMPKIQIRVSPAMAPTIESRLDALAAQSGFCGKLSVLADAAMSDADCRIEWGNGGLENISSQTWQQIEHLLSNAISPNLHGELPHNTKE